MTAPDSAAPDSAASVGTATGDAVDAVQQALAAEHAAVWAYGLATAFAGPSAAADVTAGAVTHRAHRDIGRRIVTQAGAQPVGAHAGYRTPQPVTSADTAMRLLAVAENDCCAAWRGVLERTDDAALRGTALDMLTYSAVRGTHWRQLTGQVPSAAALPGT